jgi:methyl-accepting chemotaxis protein
MKITLAFIIFLVVWFLILFPLRALIQKRQGIPQTWSLKNIGKDYQRSLQEAKEFKIKPFWILLWAISLIKGGLIIFLHYHCTLAFHNKDYFITRIIDMPTLNISQRLSFVIIAFLIPLGVLLYFFTDSINANIRFTKAEQKGDMYQRPLIALLENTTKAQFLATQGNKQALQGRLQTLEQNFAELERVQNSVGADLQFTPEGLKSRGRENLSLDKVLNKWADLQKNPQDQTLYTSLIADIRGMIAHAGDTSNLILDPDLDSYYTMDVTLLALPQTQDRLNTIANTVYNLLQRGTPLNDAEKLSIGIFANMLQEADLSRVKASLDTAFKEDVNFYGVTASFQPSVTPALKDYVHATETLIATLNTLATGGTVTKDALLQQVNNATETSFVLWYKAVDALDSMLDKRLNHYMRYKINTFVATGIALLLSFGLFLTIVRGIVRPLHSLQSTMLGLAEGNLDLPVPCLQKKDEIGHMAGAVQFFKENGLKAREIATIKAAEDAEKLERAERIEKLILNFESVTSEAVSSIATAATELSQTSEVMAHAVSDTTQKSATVSTASTQTLANVQTVASATEEMSASLQEIAKQVSASHSSVHDVVAQTANANIAAVELTEASAHIGSIASLIEGIAHEINLLALNATIEASRAGDAGKGFAVVASEVKSLARQTSKATDDIAKQIANLQKVAKQVTAVLDAIRDAITKTSQYSENIAATISEQTTVTNEIAQNVSIAASQVSDINESIAVVSKSALQADTATGDVSSASKILSQQAEGLRKDTQIFLQKIRAA